MKSNKTVAKKSTGKKNINWKVAVLCIVMAGVIAILSLSYFARKADARRFKEADTQKDKVFSLLVTKLGQPMATDEKNVCYKAERGPYDYGKLWCQVASAAYFPTSMPDNQIRSLFDDAMRDASATLKEHGFSFYGSGNLKCVLSIDDDRFATRPSFFLREESQSKQTVIISCNDRAKAKHYPFME